MFTGIIKELGVVKGLRKRARVYRLEVASKDIFKAACLGDSISINGACLTLVEKSGNVMSYDITEETMRRATLKNLKVNDRVNLEGSLKADGSIGGHFVLGHVDCAGKIKGIKCGTEYIMEVEIPGEFKNLAVKKGSIAIDGVSLTVGDIKGNAVFIYIIPHTLKETTLALRKTGDEVNVEFDILGKYAIGFNGARKGLMITEDFLKEKGF